MGFEERLGEIRERIEEELAGVFEGKRETGLWESMAHPVFAGGKRIRPLLMILSCQAVGGSVEDCIDTAVGIELVHTFTLVHDDIMDHDDLRRGKPTVHMMWDEPTAILAGDGLVTLAYQAFLKSTHPSLVSVLRVLTDGLLTLCKGQMMDKAFEIREDVTLAEYEEMILKKTATLLKVSTEVGCILGKGTEREREALKRFALDLGKAFQIQDDLLDLLSDERVTGKPRGSDLMEKKKTYLPLHFLKHAEASRRQLFIDLWQKEVINSDDVMTCYDLFKGAGTFEAAQDIVTKLMISAEAELGVLKPSIGKEDLLRIARLIQKRMS